MIIINAAGEKLNGGKPLTLVDNLNADGISVALQTENVKLYSYDPTKEKNHYKVSSFQHLLFSLDMMNRKTVYSSCAR